MLQMMGEAVLARGSFCYDDWEGFGLNSYQLLRGDCGYWESVTGDSACSKGAGLFLATENKANSITYVYFSTEIVQLI
jgi:hypothetical protein